MADDLPGAVDLLLRNVDGELEDVSNESETIVSQIRQCYRMDGDSDVVSPLFSVRVRLAAVGTDELNGYKTALVFCLQYKRNLKYVPRAR